MATNKIWRGTERNGGPWWRVLQVISVISVFWLLAPTLIVIPISFSDSKTYRFPPKGWSLRWYESMLENSQWLNAFFTSLMIGLVVAVIATVVGTIATLGLARIELRGKNLIQGFLMTPMILPVVIFAVAVYLVFLDWKLVNSFPGFVLSHTVMAIPFVIVAVSARLSGFDDNLERAAAISGARPLRVFWSITLPLIMPGVAAGALFAFITSFDELVISIFLVGTDIRTLPVMMFSSVLESSDPTVAAVSTVLMVITAIILTLALLFQRKEKKRVK